jgi:hypothetical protein
MRQGSMAQIDDDIAQLLTQFSPPIAKMAAEVIAAVRRIRPDLVPKVQFGWRSVNFRHAKAKYVCGVFPEERQGDVLLGFEHGRELDSPLLQDNGKVKQVRWIQFLPGDTIPEDDLGILLAEAIALRS